MRPSSCLTIGLLVLIGGVACGEDSNRSALALQSLVYETPLEFMRRFLQHVLPRGFVTIRHFGLLAAGNVNTKLADARGALEQQRDQGKLVASPAAPWPSIGALDWLALLERLTGIDLGVCPDCGGALTTGPLLEGPCEARAPPLPCPR